MSWYMVDVEADGPYPGDYSMVSFGVVKVDEECKTTFYGEVAPISDQYMPEKLAISNVTRTQHEQFKPPKEVMLALVEWVKQTNSGKDKVVFISDNPAFDYQWINYYLHKYTGSNIFGHSARRVGDLYSGLVKDVYKSSAWKKLKKTKHTHYPIDDARGNVEALLTFAKQYNLKIPK